MKNNYGKNITRKKKREKNYVEKNTRKKTGNQYEKNKKKQGKK